MYYLVVAGNQIEYKTCDTLKEARIISKKIAKRDTSYPAGCATIYKYTKKGDYPVETYYNE